MNENAGKLSQDKYSAGKYTVVSDLQARAELIDWIKQCRFKEFEQDRFVILSDSRVSNKIYVFSIPCYPHRLAMKKTCSDLRYRLSRRIEIWLYCQLGIYARRGFNGSQLLHNADISVPRPLAYWTFNRHGGWVVDNYFLYEYQPGETTSKRIATIKSISGNRAEEYMNELHCKIASFARQVHDAGLRHGDLHTENFLIDSCKDTKLPTGEDDDQAMKMATLWLIDHNKCQRTRNYLPGFKHFFDFKDLATTLPSIAKSKLPLQAYLGRPPSRYDCWLLNFWQRGGMNIRRRLTLWQLRGKTPNQGRHLR